MKDYGKTALYIVATLSAFLFIYLFLSWVALGPAFIPAILGEGHYLLGVGEGTSMLPFIENGDLLIVDYQPSGLHIGDVVAYVSPDGKELIGHRIIAVYDGGFIVKGDNNPYPDPWVVNREKIIGKIIFVIKDPLSKRIASMWFEMWKP